MIKFKDGFFWGSSTSAEQSEGRLENDGKMLTVWDKFFSDSPYKFHDNIGPETTSTIYKHFKEDIKLLKQTGHTAYRTSISWARLIDDKGNINQKAVTFYNSYFSLLKENGIKVFVNLYHFDTPLYIQEKYNGFVQKETVELYAKYAKTCFELFGDLVDSWFTFNEPIVSVECGYLLQYHYPLEVDSKKAVQVAYNIALASALAVKKFKKLNLKSKIGIILNITPSYPRSNNKFDVKAAHIADLFATNSFLDPCVKGEYSKDLVEILKKHDLLPSYTEEELKIIKENTVSFLGINYYQPLRVCAKANLPNDNAPFMPTYYYDTYIMPGRRINKYRGWEIYPHALYDIAKNIQNNYGNIEWFVAENGMGVEDEARFKKDGIIQDDYRIDFIKQHLVELHKAIEEGSNCKGYLHWTFIDCWSWLNAYKNRYGFIELDYNTQKRYIKKSGYWFKELSDNNGF
ncbi:glycoside hydrolase family 1 protein [Sneathia sp. DSM 16631]|uniref:glycoside hydrolase family 1 protein n=1 Tax=Sneathia TaxID=168808 RepID=UPI00186750EF|nr:MULTISPECIES: glycoside hydrolase family 1 protein [Sneathia]MBE3031469.1 glycoside hydrolase family 1 protein [Sneathia sp. DSM 16631]MDK9581561.1 glycoside hydrolase family 1 protein [Sneathia vaginalis]